MPIIGRDYPLLAECLVYGVAGDGRPDFRGTPCGAVEVGLGVAGSDGEVVEGIVGNLESTLRSWWERPRRNPAIIRAWDKDWP